jgi:hypothetical protein
VSTLFGPVVQQGYVVPDVEAAIAHWTARGIGPFFLQDITDFSGQYFSEPDSDPHSDPHSDPQKGEPIKAAMRAGFAYCGDQQIEVITPGGEHPSIYKDYLAHTRVHRQRKSPGRDDAADGTKRVLRSVLRADQTGGRQLGWPHRSSAHAGHDLRATRSGTLRAPLNNQPQQKSITSKQENRK